MIAYNITIIHYWVRPYFDLLCWWRWWSSTARTPPVGSDTRTLLILLIFTTHFWPARSWWSNFHGAWWGAFGWPLRSGTCMVLAATSRGVVFWPSSWMWGTSHPLQVFQLADELKIPYFRQYEASMPCFCKDHRSPQSLGCTVCATQSPPTGASQSRMVRLSTNKEERHEPQNPLSSGKAWKSTVKALKQQTKSQWKIWKYSISQIAEV